LDNRPLKHVPEPSAGERLRKWAARHPRLTSGGSVAAVAAAVLIGVGIGAWALAGEIRRRDAAKSLSRFDAQSHAALPGLIRTLDSPRRKSAVGDARHAIATYGVFDRADWQAGPLVSYLPPADRDRLRDHVVELLFLLAQASAEHPDQVSEALKFNDLAAGCFSSSEQPPRAVLEQRAVLLAKLGRADEATRTAAEAGRLPDRGPTDCYLRGLQLYHMGRFGDALPLLVKATSDDPSHYFANFVRGNCHFALGQDSAAARCYSVCISLDPSQAPPYVNRARVADRLKDFAQAVQDADRAVERDPDWVEAEIDAALARYRFALALARPEALRTTRQELFALGGQGLPKDQRTLLRDVEARFTAILAKPNPPTRCYFHRADVRQILGDLQGAKADVEQGFSLEPGPEDEHSWIVRGLKWFELKKQPETALADLRRAGEINPLSASALQNQSHILMELNRHQDNLAVLDRLLEMYPDLVEPRAGRAVQLARLGRTKEALADAEWVKNHSADPLMTYQIAGVYALTGDSPEALRLLAVALTRGVGYEYLAGDPELTPLRSRADFRRLTEAVRTLQDFLRPPTGRPANAAPPPGGAKSAAARNS
jgi:tetratricopeptide (TPR) repeat protein